MFVSKIVIYFILTIIFCEIFYVECRSVQYPIRSDVIVTKWPEKTENQGQSEDKQPGWMRRQLMRFGEVASRLGNTMGAHATKITSAIDKVCEVIKTIIPVIAAVCHVGQFKFCNAANEAPTQLSEALNPTSLNLDILDKR